MPNTQKPQSTRRRRQNVGAGFVVTALVATGLPLSALSASAAIVNPPANGHSIISFPARDFVSAAGYAPTDRPIVEVLRQGFVVGTSGPVTPQDDFGTPGIFDGLVDINHGAPEPCWQGVTPDIQPGDVIRVSDGLGNGDETRTAGVTVTQPATKSPLNSDIVTIKGTAVSATGGQIPVDQLESRVVANKQEFMKTGRRTLRADSTGNLPGGTEGFLKYDSATALTWTATWTGMNAVSPVDGLSDGDRAVANESRGMWNGANPLVLTEQTIYEFGQLKGPGAGCNAPASTGPTAPDMTAATDTNVTTDNITSNVRPTFGGLSGNAGLVPATGVNLYVDGVLRGSAVGSTYSVTPTTALAPGRHSVTVGATAPGGPETMSPPLSITIDTAKPTIASRAPVANVTTMAQAGNVTARFSENVTAVSGTTFTLFKAATATTAASRVGAAVTYNATTRTATLNPTAGLAPATRYTATLTAGIKDPAGNTLLASAWSFSTGPRPTVIKKVPAANLTNTSRFLNVTATFSENVGPVNTTTFRLRKTSTGVNVAAVVTYNATTHVATLNPNVASLARNTTYTAVLSTAIKDRDGNAIPATSWRFTTAP